jgi:MFS family permease
MMSSQKKKALKALISIRGYAGPDIEEELRDLEEGVSSVEESGCLDLVTRRHLLWPLLIVVGLMLFQQLSGINAVLFYTVEIFESGNFKKGDLASVVIGALMLVSTLAACVLIDKAGRRVLLLLSGLGMAVSLGFLGLFYFWTFNLASVGYEWMPLATLSSYVVSFSLGWGPVPMLVMSELFPAKVRGAASSVASIANWTFAFIVTKEFEALTGPLREHGTFWLFGGCSLAGLVFVWFFVPETKGKSLEDIELQFVKVSPLVHK